MPLKTYGVLKGRVVNRRLGRGSRPHYHLHIVNGKSEYRVAVNIHSHVRPADLFYLVDDLFEHPVLADLPMLPDGFTPLESRPGGLALDYIRGNLFDRAHMRILPFDVPGLDNDLNEKIDQYVTRAIADQDAVVYAFGNRWGPERGTDEYFHFRPRNGVHDVHMNRGNAGRFVGQDGAWRDGALFLHFTRPNEWVAIFLKFQGQSWHTDDDTGNTIVREPEIPEELASRRSGHNPDRIVRIVAARVSRRGQHPVIASLTLLNTTPQPIDLTGWSIADGHKRKHSLTGVLKSGKTRVVSLPRELRDGKAGGIFTLLNQHGLKVHGVAYTAPQVVRRGSTIVFD